MNLKTDLVSILGDLQVEKRRLTDNFRKLEGEISAQSLKMQSSDLDIQFNTIERTLDRFSILTKSLFNRISNDGLVSIDKYISEVSAKVISFGKTKKREIKIESECNNYNIDQDIIMKFVPILEDILKLFIEFSIESQDERFIRKKNKSATLKFKIKPLPDFIRLSVESDGNGVVPPFYEEHGKQLAQIGFRGRFEGISAKLSSWMFEIPMSFIFFRALGFKCSGHSLFMPLYSIVSVKPVSELSLDLDNKISGISKDLEKFKVSSHCVASFGKWIIEVSSGNEIASFVAEEILETQDLIMKSLDVKLNGDGRFLGVHVPDSNEDALGLILNPGYFVYGPSINEQVRPHAY